MGDRGATPPIPGLLTGFVTPSVVPLTVAYFDAANTLERVSWRVTDPPSGGSVSIELNTASDGSGSGISATIADGTRFITATGSVAIAEGSYLYQRVTAESGSALNLSGEYEVSRVSGVTTMLTTLAKVKLDGNISGTDADRDSVLNNLIAAVSKRMQDWMDRPIVQTTTTDEKIDSVGDYVIQTRNWPLISVSALTESGTTLVEDTDFELQPEDLERGQIYRISGEDVYPWVAGRRAIKITYDHGYAAVPDSLVQAATAQVLADFADTAQSGNAWRGLLSRGVDPAAATTYDKAIWERETIPAMLPYRRLAA